MICLEWRYYNPNIRHAKMNLIAYYPIDLYIVTLGELFLIKV